MHDPNAVQQRDGKYYWWDETWTVETGPFNTKEEAEADCMRYRAAQARDELKRYLIKCCYWYYVKCNPLISDYKFDMKFKELQALESGVDADKDSPTQIVWGDREDQYPDWVKVR